MARKKTFYITTAIDYVNGKPHLGHAYEKVFADCIARWKRLLGFDVFFLTGTDENALKNVEAAKKEGINVRDFVERNAKLFIKLCKLLNLSNTDFIRTTEERHKKVVQKIFNLLYKKNQIYKGYYEGIYCPGCEAFKTEKELVNGRCPEHPNLELKVVKEESYFFRLSKYEKKILQLLKKKEFVIPEDKRKEMISRIKKEGLKDLCVSRKNVEWGIKVPFDKKYVIYVWIDALTNYISALGWPKGKFKKYWPAVHVIGKDINWFHSVIWPSILLASGIEVPKSIVVHGFINIKGRKLSKSAGLAVDPLELIDKYGTDILRFSLLRLPFYQDSDFSEDDLVRYNNELADKLGNLVLRVTALAEKYGIEKCKNSLLEKLRLKEIKSYMEKYAVDKALNLIFDFIDDCNSYVQENKLWQTHDKKKIYQLIDSIKAIAILLWPFIPSTSEKIAGWLGFKIKNLSQVKKPLKIKKIKKAQILFKKIKLEKKEEKELAKETEDKKMTVSFDEWKKLELKVGKIIDVKDHPDASKLYLLDIDLGNEKRTLVAGLKNYYKPEELKGKLCIVFTNLEPKTIRGIESKGMVLAAVNKEKDKVVLIEPEKEIEIGSRVE